ncbi:DUF4126 domain-containing protein [Pannus brasiliensis CCIBt3594]|uniref:DUF4126 domain-containing protein n=1 Tax=Pannus brasiliensis CCIBt3594 TaxID=1427578 RepID=A0AAW9QRE3_9CHRO
MENWLNLDTLVSLLLGISLSAACGFRLFLPFLVVSAMAIFGHIGLPSDLSWLGSDRALLMLGIASIVEIMAYYVPFIDNLLDPIALPLATVAGTMVTAFTLPEMNSILQWTLAAIVGGGSAGLIKGTTGLSRLGSTFLSGGWANFLLSTAEWIGASLLAFLALTLPIGAGILAIIVLGVAIFKFWPWVSQRFFKLVNNR